NATEKVVAIDLAIQTRSNRRFLNCGLNFLDTISRGRMCGQPVGNALVRACVLEPIERRQHCSDACRIPPAACGIPRAKGIRLKFIVAAVLEKQHAQPALRKLTEWLGGRNEDAAKDQTKLRTGRAGVLLRGMTRRHMADLMSKHPGHLRFI